MKREQARILAERLVAQMTLEEAAGQLIFRAPAIERLGIPAYDWWNEALHGVARAGMATMFPQAIGMAATFDPDLIEQLGDVAATEGRAKYNAASRHGDTDIYKGLTFWSPNINIFRDPRWGRGQETFGEDPYLTGEMGAAYVRGLQGTGDVMKAAACAKHFAVHSGPEDLRHEFDARASAKDMAETYLPAFEKLVREFFPGIPFVAILGNREGYPLKPDPEIVGEVLRTAVDIEREEAVMVGDSRTDMLTAANGGISAIAVCWGYRIMEASDNYRLAGSVTELRTLLFGREVAESPELSCPDGPQPCSLP